MGLGREGSGVSPRGPLAPRPRVRSMPCSLRGAATSSGRGRGVHHRGRVGTFLAGGGFPHARPVPASAAGRSRFRSPRLAAAAVLEHPFPGSCRGQRAAGLAGVPVHRCLQGGFGAVPAEGRWGVALRKMEGLEHKAGIEFCPQRDAAAWLPPPPPIWGLRGAVVWPRLAWTEVPGLGRAPRVCVC